MQLNPSTAWIEGFRSVTGTEPRKLVACDVRASDLRAGAALVLCDLAAEGESTIEMLQKYVVGTANFGKS
jgi:UDP-N-acetylglucosamine enolpyruvyl transferase